MTQYIFANNVNTSLFSAITSTATSLTLLSATNLPTLAAGQIMPLTLNDKATRTVFEIVYVTTISGTNLTVIRGQEGTVAQNWNAGDYCYSTQTAQTTELAIQSGTYNYALDTGSTPNAYVVALTPSIPATIPDGFRLNFSTTRLNTGPSTANGLPIKKQYAGGYTNLVGNEIYGNSTLVWSAAQNAWVIGWSAGLAMFLAPGSGASPIDLQTRGRYELYPEDFGAKGDTNLVSNMYQGGDGAMTSGSAALTCATFTPFVATDVGKTIGVKGAGVSGATLAATITGYTSASTVTLSATASTTVSAARVIFGTDDTTALTNWLAACKANPHARPRLLPKNYFCASNALVVDQSMDIVGTVNTFLVPTPSSSAGAMLNIAVTPNTPASSKNISGQMIGVKITGISAADWRMVPGVAACGLYNIDQANIESVSAYGMMGGKFLIGSTNPFNSNSPSAVRESHFEKCFDIFSGGSAYPNLYVYTTAYSGGPMDAHNDLFFNNCKSIYAYGGNISLDSLNTSLKINEINFINQQVENGAFLPEDAGYSVAADEVFIGNTNNNVTFTNSWIAGNMGYVAGTQAGYACLRVGNAAAQKSAFNVSFVGGYISSNGGPGIVVESVNSLTFDTGFALQSSAANALTLVVGALPNNTLTVGNYYGYNGLSQGPNINFGAGAYVVSGGSTFSYASNVSAYVLQAPLNQVAVPVSNNTTSNLLVGEVSAKNATNYAGATAGEVYTSMPEQGVAKKFVAGFAGYENNTTTNLVIPFPTPFTASVNITFNGTGLTASASGSALTITAPNNTTTYSGVIVVEGI